MIYLLPRLPRPDADLELRGVFSRDLTCPDHFDSINLPDSVRFGATGGTIATLVQLNDLRTGLRSIAESHGFPQSRSRNQLANFDRDAAAWLADYDLLKSGEALRDDVWAFISIVVVPDIVFWRFENAEARYLGGVRNTFQRLWLRGIAMDRGEGAAERWILLSRLTEDAMVQITERPSIGGDHILAREVAEGWVRASEKYGTGSMEPIMRRAILRIRILNEFRNLSSLNGSVLRSTIDDAFAKAAQQ